MHKKLLRQVFDDRRYKLKGRNMFKFRMKKIILNILKVYFAFSAVNIAYKCSQILKLYFKTRLLWKHVPGSHTDLTGMTFMKNVKRLPDWATEISNEHKKAHLIQMPYFEPLLACNTAESVQW